MRAPALSRERTFGVTCAAKRTLMSYTSSAAVVLLYLPTSLKHVHCWSSPGLCTSCLQRDLVRGAGAEHRVTPARRSERNSPQTAILSRIDSGGVETRRSRTHWCVVYDERDEKEVMLADSR